MQRQCLAVAVVGFLLSSSFGCAENATAMRLVKLSVVLDDEVVLATSGGASDNVDADEMWNRLATEEFGFVPTGAFAKAATEAQPDGSVIVKGKGRLRADYGGSVQFLDLKLIKSKNDKDEAVYRIDPEFIRREFRFRLISRGEAASLKNPQLPR